MTKEQLQQTGSGFCVRSKPNRFLIINRWREYLSSGENRAVNKSLPINTTHHTPMKHCDLPGCAETVGLPSEPPFCRYKQIQCHDIAVMNISVVYLQSVNSITSFVEFVHQIHFVDVQFMNLYFSRTKTRVSKH